MLSSMTMTDPAGVIPQWELPHRLVRAREYAGLTQPELAAALGIGVRTVKRYENGEAAKRVVVLGWAFACGVNATWLETGIAPYTGAPTTGSSDCYPVPYRAA